MPQITGSRFPALVGFVTVAICLMTARAAEAGEVRGRVPWPEASTMPTVVWVEGTKIDAGTIRKPIIVSQKDMQFVPAFSVASRGQTVQFPNYDNVAHSVFSISPAKPFQLGTFEEQARRSVIADGKGVIEIKCALHRRMSATLFVVDSAHYVMAQANGMFAIQNVPPGKHRIKAWRGGESIEAEANVTAEGVTLVSFRSPPTAVAQR